MFCKKKHHLHRGHSLDEHYSMERELVLYMYLIQSNICRSEFSSFVKDVLWYFVFIILYRNIGYVIKI